MLELPVGTQQFFDRILTNDMMPGAYDGVSQDEITRGVAQAIDITRGIKEHLPSLVATAHPEYEDQPDTREKADKEVSYVTLKAVGFCGLLAAGQIEDTELIKNDVYGICMMYLADQAVDNNDEHMSLSLETLYGLRQPHPDDHPYMAAHMTLPLRIPHYLRNAVLPDDLPRVRVCFEDQVLMNEVRHHRASEELLRIGENPTAVRAFWENRGDDIAEMITVMAGFPSVSHSLHAAHRRDNPALRLPALQEIDDQPELIRMLRISNVLVRLLDDAGDSDTDWGNDPERGIFCINWLNQARQAGIRLIEPLMRLGEIPQAAQQGLTEVLMDFGNPDQAAHKQEMRDHIARFALTHAQNTMDALPVKVKSKYGQYIQYAKRVHIIGQENIEGDKALGKA
ncbi:MAG: hypothetical protein JWP13_430 [Candidatus Saccharibacteria bacterium]|nr:hypothetical protein [Candidatus Saccharibacteria bacterium]